MKNDKVPKQEEQVPNISSKKKRLLIVVIVLIVLIASAAGGFIIWKKKTIKEDDAITDSEEVQQQVEKAVEKTTYERIDKFTLNLASSKDNSSDRYVQFELYVTIVDNDDKSLIQSLIKDSMPEIKHHVILSMAKYDADMLSDIKGKQILFKDLSEIINEILSKHKKERGLKIKQKTLIKEVLFTEFIIQ